MSTGTFTEATPAELAQEAREIRAAVRNMQWPESREARLSIGWQYGETADALAEYEAVVNDEAVLHFLGIPDLAHAGDEEGRKQYAAWWTADRALECARELRRRLGQYQGAGNGTGGRKS